MQIEFDPEKRAATLVGRGLDFADAPQIFGGDTFTWLDERVEYGEDRFVTMGLLRSRTVVLVWTWRQHARRIISMRYANEKEVALFKRYLG
ncbi:BrnT family toxin [Duganella violaceipulchra]|uniref:BrnT family toxin n=1 Tax=Duganella violaceipulchra TaxID=2849652 RepID=A0AA41H8X2_9BURK|nr:BrnT family toxin [Duganella violaceicalia]MBV6320447.1 BrnT family toxin [Duganella violaceicalia]MCP2012282.1 uncharacterized DUF497 family protein [Duganella violaceicalia]